MFKKFIKKWIMFFLFLGFSLFMSLKTSFVSFSFIFWVLSSVLLFSLILLAMAYFGSKLYFERKITLKIEEDDFLDISLEIKNKNIFPLFDIIIKDYLSCASPSERDRFIKLDQLHFGSVASLKYRCFCPDRGRFVIGPLTVYFFEPLGLFYFKRTYNIFSELYVYPRTFNIHKFPILSKGSLPWFGIETARVSGDDDEFYGVREYKSGDPLKKIHWMATARRNKLIVKQFQRQSFFRATIIFNLQKESNFGEGKERVAEYIIRIVASIAKYLINSGVSVELVFHAGEAAHIPFNKGAEHLDEILKLLTIAQAESRISILELFDTYSRNISEFSTLISVMADKENASLSVMSSLGDRSISLIPIIINTATFMQNYGESMGTKDFIIERSDKANSEPIYIARQDNLEEKF